MAGRRFGRLLVVERAPSEPHRRGARWACHCDCGQTSIVATRELRTGDTKSCGCWNRDTAAARRRTHGASYSREYVSWANMWQRCTNPKHPSYPRYGGRGITICERWRSFANFLADMGPRPPDLTIERTDNDGHYTPENCVWDTRKRQGRNKSNNKRLPYQGVAVAMAEAVERSGAADYFCVRGRLNRGWDADRALQTPPHPGYQAGWRNRKR